ncbi:putative Peroxisomal long-chain fatty acid import protein 2 [Glarea lozoyensis 74030]|uniref:Putative Peroxisomal long-chain fatty acid import protein 2 n=1 Tax=Glarea lozoyensis (strain ATCC 74030 / MF5533) TaxID=1104152 RepID=H0EXN9_GLAL7|nr:putative Peroxisomal long-chain fatty acid import protein 2 [Glarea lozoyensis 74030]
MLRTYLSLVVARLDGEIVRDLVAGNGRSFIWGIIKWCGIGSFASYTNAMIKFLQSKVSIAFRTRLTSWSAYGYLLSSLPVFLPAWGGLGGIQELADASVSGGRERGRMKEFITNKRLMLSLADAGGRMMYSIKDLSELAGYTSRVYTLISTLHRVHANAYFPPQGTHPELFSLSDVQGTIQKGFDGVRLENVPIVAPSVFPHGGEELIDSLSMIVHSGEHLLISGPNGAGKSAVARIVAGLWPVYLIYPDGEIEMRDKNRRDIELKRVLEEARLGYLPDREGGWDTRKEWKDVLSGGEKQRMAIARLLYHEPRYAFIDEGTSAVSSDVEGLLYERCKEKGITLITISTRASLKRYHTFNLSLGMGEDGTEWEWERIGTVEEKMGVERELQQLRERLEKVKEWESRKGEIEEELNKVWVEGGEELDDPAFVTGDEGEG